MVNDDVNSPVGSPAATNPASDPASSQLSGLEDAIDAAKQVLGQADQAVPPVQVPPVSPTPTEEFSKVFGSDSAAPAAPPTEEVPVVSPDAVSPTDSSTLSSQGASGLSEAQEKDLAEKLKQKIDEDVDQILTEATDKKPSI